jgi:DNA-binding NarL/FixJ family response regulator
MRRGRPPYPGLLTPREQEVLVLLQEGLTNGEIAERLNISGDGAKFHVSEILTELGV